MPDMMKIMRERLEQYAVQEADTVQDFLRSRTAGEHFWLNDQHENPSERMPQKMNVNFSQSAEVKVLMHPHKLQKDGASPLHRHSYFEMGYVFDGQCVSVSDGEESSLKTGDLFIVSLQALHQMKTCSKEDHVFNIMISTHLFDEQFFGYIARYDLFSQFFLNSIFNIPSDACLVFHSDEQTDFSYYILKILYEYIICNRQDPNYVRLLLACIFQELSRKYQQEMEQKSRRENEGLSISNVLKYLAKNYATATLKSVADHFHYTPRFMTGFISKYTGSSFVHILRELKLQNAWHQVLHTDLSFDQITKSVGYNERGYLDRVFKKRYGKTMSECRKKS